MSLVFVDKYGAPDYGTRKGTVAAVLHTTEGSGRTKAAALATAQWQATSGNTSGGSYHYILGQDGDVVTAVRSVRIDHIAGSISTRRDAIWIADTDTELRQFMGSAAVADPNSYVIAISIQGQVAWFNQNGWPKAMVDAIALLLRQLEQRYSIKDIYVCGHYRFQSNRTDPGLKLIPAVISSYERQFRTPDPSPVNTLKTVRTFPLPGAKFHVGPTEAPLNLFQIVGWNADGQPTLKRYPAEPTGIKWSDSSWGLATERRTWKDADPEGWLYCPQVWTPQYGTLKGVYISKSPLAEPKIVLPESETDLKAQIAALQAETSGLRDKLSVATTELSTAKQNLTAATTIITKKNAAIDAARAIK